MVEVEKRLGNHCRQAESAEEGSWTGKSEESERVGAGSAAWTADSQTKIGAEGDTIAGLERSVLVQRL